MAIQQYDRTSEPRLPYVVIGTARLPATVAGDQGGVLMVEVTLDSQEGRVLDVATTVGLPAYTDLLRRLMIGTRLDDVAQVVQRLDEHLSGPLLKPTIAALAKGIALADKVVPEH